MTAPGLVAATDQQVALITDFLRQLVAAERVIVADRGAHDSISVVALWDFLASSLPPKVLASVLAVAIRRLAAHSGGDER